MHRWTDRLANEESLPTGAVEETVLHDGTVAGETQKKGADTRQSY